MVYILPHPVIGKGCHGLIEIAPCQGSYYGKHLGKSKAHCPAAIRGGPGECCGPQPYNCCLNILEIIMRDMFFHGIYFTL